MPYRRTLAIALGLAVSTAASADDGATVEVCLRGEIDLGVRRQGFSAEAGTTHPAEWCVTAEPGTSRVRFASDAAINADVRERFVQSYPEPRTVRIVDPGSSLDLVFVDAEVENEAARYRRIIPSFLVRELASHPGWRVDGSPAGWQRVRYPGSPQPVDLRIDGGQLHELRTTADLPLRGRVPVTWRWTWSGGAATAPDRVQVAIDGETFFRGTVHRRELDAVEAAASLSPVGTQPPREIPGEHWPSRVAPRRVTIEPGVHQIRNLRTGFHPLVVETADGLVVADAPAGWVELAQIPPADLVPALGVSGLSEHLVDFLRVEFPDRPVRAVALTHAHDDHVGGARAFAAAGAAIYSPAGVELMLEAAFNRDAMPVDRLTGQGRRVEISPVAGRVELADDEYPIELVPLAGNPHAQGMLGVWLPSQRIFFQSDLHAPDPGAGAPAPSRAASECWFATWAVDNLPADARVMSAHGAVVTPYNQFVAWRNSAACAAALR
jgi:glyoxylase-like metal-dependent hydrolase (beta-lactamase superfamily II)